MNHPGDRARSSVSNTHQANKHTRITAAINLKGRKNAYDRRRYSKHIVLDFYFGESHSDCAYPCSVRDMDKDKVIERMDR